MTKAEIDNIITSNVYTNDAGLITGLLLQQVLLSMTNFTDEQVAAILEQLHSHSNKQYLDLIQEKDIDVLSKLSIVNGNLQIDANAYSTGELSAYGLGSGGSSGGGEAISTLSDVQLTGLVANQYLRYNGTHWVNTNLNIVTSWNELTDKPTTFAPSSHTHAISDVTGLQVSLDNKYNTPSGTANQYIKGDGTLATFPSIPQGTVTSVGISVPVGLSVSNSPITSSGVVAIGLQTGYSIPTTAKQGQWDTAYDHSQAEHQAIINGTGFVKANGKTLSYDNNSYSLASHNHSGVYEPVFTKNSAFNKNFGTTSGTVAEGNHTHSYLPLSGGDIKRTFAGWPNDINSDASNYINQRIFGVSTAQNTLSFFGDGNPNARRFGIQSGHESPLYASAFGILELNPFGGVVKINGTTAATVNSNVASATKLQTARTIAGVSFDGTANIAIPFANLSSKPTTLGGYGITDAYTKTEVNSALTSKLDKSVFDDLFEKVNKGTEAAPVWAIEAKHNFYSVGELSAYGIGSGGSSGGSYERLDAWVDYDSTKSGWVLSALLGVGLNTRVGNLEGGSALTVNATGTGNAITSISKAGTVITANKGLTFALASHTHTSLSVPDTRAIFSVPENLQVRELQLDFKYNSSVGYPPITASPTFSHIISFAGWSVAEGSGGWPSQMSIGDGIAVRRAVNATTWGEWRNVYHTGNLTNTLSNGYLPYWNNGSLVNSGIKQNSNDIIISGNVGSNGILKIIDSSTEASIGYKINGSTENTGWVSGNYNNKFFIYSYTYGGQVLSLNNNGNVGIGEPSPAYKLDVAGTGRFTDTVTAPTFQGSIKTPSGVEYLSVGTNISAVGWYRVFVSSMGNSDGASVILNVNRNYTYANNESYTFSINVAYNGAISITQLSGVANARLISKIRVDYVNSGVLAVDIYYNLASLNTVYISGSGIGQFQAPSLVLEPTGTTVEFDTVNGVKSDLGFTGNLTGNASSATKLQTARTIWGQSFDGTGNVTGALSGATTGVFSSTVQATTAILTNLTANYLPKHTASGLVNSLIYDNGTNVGIGTTNPVGKLQIVGGWLDVDRDNGGVRFTSGSATRSTIFSNSNNDIILGNPSGNILTASGSTGNVGIGNVSPGYKLDVSGTGRFTDTVTAPTFIGALSGNATTATKLLSTRTNWYGTGVIDSVVGQLAWKNYGNGHTIFDASGSTSPDETACNNKDPQVAWEPSFPTLMGWNGIGTYGVRVDSSRVADKLLTAKSIWGQSFDGTGNVTGDLIVPDANILRVAQLHTSDYTTMEFYSRAWSSVQGTNGKAFKFTTHTDAGSGGYEALVINYGESGSILLKPTGNGNVGIGTTSPSVKLHVAGNILSTGEITAYVASDRRLKHNITPLVSSLDIIDKLNPVSYYWNAKAKELNPMKSDSLDYGLIAQEVENVLPGVVHGIFDDKYKSIDYIKLIPIMIAAIKELKQKVNKL